MTIRSMLWGGAALAAFQPATAQDPDAKAWKPHRELAVLYAGKEGGHREKVFGEFLACYFDRSATIPASELTMERAEGYDLVIVDWVSQYGNDGYPTRDGMLFSVPVDLSEEFTKPVITMSYVSSNVRRDYKLDWL